MGTVTVLIAHNSPATGPISLTINRAAWGLIMTREARSMTLSVGACKAYVAQVNEPATSELL
jgi:hypothetical protein